MIEKGLDASAADMIGNYVNMNGKKVIYGILPVRSCSFDSRRPQQSPRSQRH